MSSRSNSFSSLSIPDEAESHLSKDDLGFKKVYGPFSLLCLGIGASIGSGIFVLNGAISRNLAGPAAPISWVLGGFVCLLTALSYAELSCIVHSNGSAYSFTYRALGEVFAVVAAWCLTLEYGMSAAAVSRSWGDKVGFYLSQLNLLGCSVSDDGISECWLSRLGTSNISLAGGFLCVVATFALSGVEHGRNLVNILVILKLGLVLFVTLVGFAYFNAENLHPFIPPRSPEEDFFGGFEGIIYGSLSAVFGFIGFDEVTCLTLESKNPKFGIPFAVLGTVGIVTVLYCFGSLALVGMVKYSTVDVDEGFGSAFGQVGAQWAMHVTLIGETLVVLPAVVLVDFLPQFRLFAAMATDELLPSFFAETDEKGNLFRGIPVTGCMATIVALFIPFQDLNDLISGGVLIAFNLSNVSLLVLRTESNRKSLALISAFVLLSLILAFWSKKEFEILQTLLFSVLLLLAFLLSLYTKPPSASDSFSVPFVPYTTCAAILANSILFSRLRIANLFKLGIGTCLSLVGYAIFRGIQNADGLYSFLRPNGVVELSVVDQDANHTDYDSETDDKAELSSTNRSI